jgi:hypothetical protein
LTGYDLSCPKRRVEAMKRPSRAGGGKSSKARSRRPSRLKRNIVSKAVAHRNAATDRIAEWLEKLGLGQYAQRLPRTILTSLNCRTQVTLTLTRIRVSLVYRRTILAAFAKLAGSCLSSDLTPEKPEDYPGNYRERHPLRA